MCSPMAMYVISEEDQPWNVLFTARTLEGIAECLVAQPDRSKLRVCFNDAGFTRDLDAGDRRRLAELIDG